MRKERISIDMDGVIADLISIWISRYNYDYSDKLQTSDIKLWNWHTLTKESCQEKIYDYLDDPDLFLDLPVIKDSQWIIYELSKRYELFVVTAAYNPNNIPAKDKWLRRHFEFINPKNFVFTRNKSIIDSDYLIDDKPENFIDLDARPLLFTAPHNLNNTQFHRVNDWQVVGQWFDVI